MTKSKFLFSSILFFVALSSVGQTAKEKELNSDNFNIGETSFNTSSELISITNISPIEVNQKLEKINPPINSKINQKVKACHRQKIGPIIIAVATGVGVLGFVIWAIATNV